MCCQAVVPCCVSIDEKPVRRCAPPGSGEAKAANEVSIDEKPVRRCA